MYLKVPYVVIILRWYNITQNSVKILYEWVEFALYFVFDKKLLQFTQMYKDKLNFYFCVYIIKYSFIEIRIWKLGDCY